MRGAHEQVLDEVAVLHVHPGDPASAALLLAVGGQRQRLDVAGLGDRDHHLLVGDQVLDVDLVLGVGDLRAPLVAEALRDLRELLLDDRQHAGLVAEDRAQLGDPLGDVGVLLLDPVGLERRQLGEAQVEDRGGLDVAQLEARDQLLARCVAVARAADQLDDRVEIAPARSTGPGGCVRAPPSRTARAWCGARSLRAGGPRSCGSPTRRFSVRGTLSTSATMFTPNVVCIGVCL